MSTFAGIKNWWATTSETRKKVFFVVLFSCPGIFFGICNFARITNKWLASQKHEFTAASGPYIVPPFGKLSRQQADTFKDIDQITTVVLPNHMGTPLNNVSVLIPRQGHAVVLIEDRFDQGNQEPVLCNFLGHLDFKAIPNGRTITIQVWHKDKLELGEQITVTSWETDKVALPLPQAASSFYPAGFWFVFIALYVSVVWNLLTWYRKPAPIAARRLANDQHMEQPSALALPDRPGLMGPADSEEVSGDIAIRAEHEGILKDRHSFRFAASKPILIRGLASVFFISVFSIAFYSISESILLSYDGVYFRSMSELQRTWAPFSFSSSASPLFGFGNVFYPFNSRLSPAYIIGNMFTPKALNTTILYTVIAAELALSICFMGNTMRLPRSVVAFAMWFAPLLSLPVLISQQPLLYPISHLAPHFFEQIAAHVMFVGLFYAIGRRSISSAVTMSVSTYCLLALMTISGPAGIILHLPPIALGCIVLIAGADSWKERKAKVISILAIGLVSSATILPFIIGNYLYSVPTFFSRELQNDRISWSWVSCLFHDQAGPYLVLSSFFGSLLAVTWGSKPMKMIGSITLISSLAIIGGGAVITFCRSDYRGPSPLYFEIGFWPFYFLTAAYLFRGIALVMLLIIRWLGGRASSAGLIQHYCVSAERIGHDSRTWLGFVVSYFVTLLVVWGIYAHRQQHADYPYPPKATPIVDYLVDHVGLTPGKLYRGTTATFTGYYNLPKGVSWFDLLNNDIHVLVGNSGNDYRAMGLWYYHIPTVFEYSPFISPSYHLVMSRMLSRPQDRQLRSVIVLTKPHAEYLQSLGVRYVLSEQTLNDPFVRHLDEMVKTPAAIKLYELPHPNLGSYSPIQFIVNPDFRSAVEVLGQATFDFQRQAVISEPLDGNYAPADKADIRVETGQFVVSASSAGRSVLLLPLQYSHCLDLKLRGSEKMQEPPRLVRMNVMQAGLVFSGKIEVEIRFSNGPFHKPFGRIQDYLDFRSHYTVRGEE